MSRWLVDPINDFETHVVPVADCGEHTADTCPCSPEYEPHGEQVLITHNAFDRRELFERRSRERG